MGNFSELRSDLTGLGFGALNSVVRPAVRAGFTNPLPVGLGAVVLETTGRKSGLPRSVPLVATRVGGNLVVSTVRGDSQWLKNIEADSNVTVWLMGQPRSAVGKVARGSLNIVTLVLD